MAITVKYFAVLREQVGRSEDTVGYEQGMTVADAWSKANKDRPLPGALMVAVNMKYAKADAGLSDGDEVAFFPAVTGG